MNERTRLRVLRERKTELQSKARTLLEAADQRDLSAVEQDALNAYKAELTEVNGKLDEFMNHLEEIKNAPIGSASGGMLTRFLPGGGSSPARGDTGRGVIGATYAKLFGDGGGNDGWGSAEEFLGTLRSGMFDPRFKAMREGDGPSGGYAVPAEYSKVWLDSIIESSILLPRCRVFPMTSNELRVPGFDSSTAASNVLLGGIERQWLSEEGSASITNPTTRQVRLIAKKMGLYLTTSNELLADCVGIEGQVRNALTQAGSWYVDEALIRGTGAGSPLGLLCDPALITCLKETDQDADSLLYENFVSMYGRMHPSCRPNSIWILSSDAVPELLQVTIPIGISGTYVPLLNESNGEFRIFGRPCFFTEKASTLGDAGDCIFVDPTQMAVGLRSELAIETSQHVYFASDKTAWRALMRFDGQGTWNSTYQPANGGATQSWVVTLEARA